jgi:hypothetical protein
MRLYDVLIIHLCKCVKHVLQQHHEKTNSAIEIQIKL